MILHIYRWIIESGLPRLLIQLQQSLLPGPLEDPVDRWLGDLQGNGNAALSLTLSGQFDHLGRPNVLDKLPSPGLRLIFRFELWQMPAVPNLLVTPLKLEAVPRLPSITGIELDR